MTTRGEPAPDQRARRKRALALIGVLAVSATVATWVEVHYAGGGVGTASTAGGNVSQDSLSAPVGGDDPSAAASTLPESTSVLPATIDVPAGFTNPGAFQVTRYALATATDCTDVLVPSPPAGVTKACQGYVTASYVSTDHSVVASVTVLGYADAAAAQRAKPLLSGAGVPGSIATFRPPGNELQNVTPAVATQQQRVEQVGRFVTVVQAAAVNSAPQVPSGSLTATDFTVSAQIGDAVLWDE